MSITEGQNAVVHDYYYLLVLGLELMHKLFGLLHQWQH